MTENKPEDIIRVNDVSVTFGMGRRRLRALDKVSLAVRKNEVLGVIGETGSGKTTLLRAIAGLAPLSEGTISFDRGGTSRKASRQKGAARVQVVFQNASDALNPRIAAWKSVVEPVVPRSAKSPAALRPVAIELISRMGLSADIADRLPGEMSGGQRQRVTIARALASDAPVILLDEPVASLDASIQGEVLKLLADLRVERALTYVIISHDLGAVAALADRVAVLYLGKIVEIAPTTQILTEPQHPYTRALIDAVPRMSTEKGRSRIVITGEMPDPRHPPMGCRFHTRCPFAREVCRATEPELLAIERFSAIGDLHSVACHRNAEWPAEERQETDEAEQGTERVRARDDIETSTRELVDEQTKRE